MISKETLVKKIKNIAKDRIGLKLSKYTASDFVSEESEQSLYIFSLDKPLSTDRENIILQALIDSGINQEYLDETFFDSFHFQQADPLIAKEIIEEVTSDLTQLKETNLTENITECMILVNEWNYLCLYFEKPNQLFVMIWETTA